MTTQENKVIWRALLDIVNVKKNAKEAERDLKRLEDRERSVATTFAESDRKISRASDNQTASLNRLQAGYKRVSSAYQAYGNNTADHLKKLRDLQRAQTEHLRLTDREAALSARAAGARAREAAATERSALAQIRLATAQQKVVDAQKAHEAVSSRANVTAAELAASTDRLTKAQENYHKAAAKSAQSSATLSREQSSASRSAKEAATANDRLAVSIERVNSRTLEVQKTSSSRWGGSKRAIKDLQTGYQNLANAAGGFADILLIKVPAAAAALGGLGTIVSSLVAGIVGLAGALGPVVGLLGAIPGAMLGAATGIGTLVAGFGGIGKALKAYGKQQQSAAKDAKATAKSQADAARRVRDSQRAVEDAQKNSARSARDSARAVRDAYESAADSARNSAQRIVDAEENLQRAQRDSSRAQVDLNRARGDAIRQLEDLKRAVRDAAFSEEEAAIAVEEARKRLEDTRNSSSSTNTDLQRADLDYREAVARLGDARKARIDANKENAEAQAKGVEGTDSYVSAQERAADASKNVVDAQKDLRDAQIESAKAARDSAEAISRALESQKDSAQSSARAIESAQENLADAYAASKEAAEGGTTAANAFKEAMNGLSPAARAFVTYLISLKDKLESLKKTASTNLLPGVQSGLQSLMKLFPLVEATVGRTAKIIGDSFASIGARLSSPEISGAIGRVFTSNETALGDFLDGVESLAVYFVHVADAARPLVEYLAGIFKTFAKGREDIPTSEMATFFDKTISVVGTLGRIFGNLWTGLKNVGKAGEDFGNHMLSAIEHVSLEWSQWTGSMEGQNRLKQWFTDAEPIVFAMAGLFKDIAKYVLDFGTSDSIVPFIDALRTKVLPNLERFLDLMMQNGADGFTGLLVSLSEALVSMAESGALGGLTKVMDFLKVVVDAFSELVKLPGVGTILSTMAAGLFAFKALKFGASITGLSNLYLGVKKLYSLRGRSRDARTLAADIAAISAATGQSPAQVGAAYGVGANGKKVKGKKGATPVVAPAFGQKKPTVAAAAKPTTRSRVGGAVKGGAGVAGAAGMALSFIGLEGPLGTIVGLFSMLLGFLPMLMPVFAAIGGAIAAIGAPILIIVGLVAAFIGGLVLLYKNNEAFRNFIDKAWQGIKDAIVNVWENYILPAFRAIGSFITDTLAPAFVWFWNNVITPVFAAIGSIISFAWNRVIQPIFSAIWGFISELLAPLFLWFWKTIIRVAFDAIGAIISFAWNSVIKPVFDAINGFINDVLGPVFEWLWKTIIKPIWDGIGGAIKFAWNNVIKPIFDALKTGVEAIGSVFESVRDTISTAWGNLVGLISGPIQTALKWVQQHLIDPINSLLSKIGISWQIGSVWQQADNVGSGMANAGRTTTDRRLGTRGYASGGRVAGSSPHERADNIPAMLTAGEYVLPVPAVRRISQQMGPGYLENLRQGRPRRYASGGFVRPVNGKPSFPWGHYPSGGVHRALDIPVPVGTPVVASMPGSVLASGWDKTGFGNHIRLAFNNGQYMILGHLSRLLAERGDRVSAGERIALSGNTGRSTGPHVHVEMRTSPYDPSTAFNFSNAFFNGKPTEGTRTVQEDNIFSNIALGIYDGITGPIKTAASTFLNPLGFPGKFLLGAAQALIGGVRGKISDFTKTSRTENWSEFANDPNAPTDRIGYVSNISAQNKEMLARGGRVPGTGNQDTVPAMLTPGEFVVRRAAVQAIGLGNLRALNGDTSGGNFQGGVGYFNKGGPVPQVGGRGYYQQGQKHGFMNIVRMLLGLGYNTGSATPIAWDSAVSTRLAARKGILPSAAGVLNPVWSKAKKDRLISLVNAGGSRYADQRSIWDVANAMGVKPMEIVSYTARNSSSTLAKMSTAKRARFLATRTQVQKAWQSQVKQAQAATRQGQTGTWNTTLSNALSHLMIHGTTPQPGHSDYLPATWPQTALQTAAAQQLRANDIQNEFNRALDTLSTWGLGDLVDKLLDLGPTEGIGMAREAVKSRAIATDYNSKLAASKQLVATTSPEAYKYVAYLNSSTQPGIRDAARTLGLPDYAVVNLWEKLLGVGRVSASNPNFARMIKEVGMFRKGVFYAATGGQVPGTGSGDTVPAMLTPGEFVLRKSAVRALGLGNVEALNNMQYFANGGPVYAPQTANLPGLSSRGVGVAAGRIMAQGTQTTVNINTVINNPVRESSSQSLSKMLRRKAAVGEFGDNAVVGEDTTNG